LDIQVVRNGRFLLVTMYWLHQASVEEPACKCAASRYGPIYGVLTRLYGNTVIIFWHTAGSPANPSHLKAVGAAAINMLRCMHVHNRSGRREGPRSGMRINWHLWSSIIIIAVAEVDVHVVRSRSTYNTGQERRNCDCTNMVSMIFTCRYCYSE
jgi:hypothetical protein